jgi:hypothetical protein
MRRNFWAKEVKLRKKRKLEQFEEKDEMKALNDNQ